MGRQFPLRCTLFFLSLVMTVGCTSGSGLVGVPGRGPGVVTGPPPLPPTDVGLAEHVPQQVVIRFVPGADTQRVLASISGTVLKEIKELDAVVVALPDRSSVVEAIRKVQGAPGVRYAEPNYIYRAFIVPNDPFFASKQWGPQKINASAAWDVTTGSPNSVVALIDTGVSSAHPEFSGKILAGTNCTTDLGGSEDNNGHGTHVAGIAASIGNNGTGIAGLAWGSSILPIKVLNSAGSGTNDTITCGITFASTFALLNPSLRLVINMSLGGPGYAQLMKDAVDSALQNNVVVIAAAGNDGKATVMFPAGYPGVIAVGATTPTNQRASFSTYGSHLSVVAPGLDIYSTWLGGSFRLELGTSMAAPHVAGVAALVRVVNPALTPAQVRSQIEQTAADLGTPGFDVQFGWGLVNAAAAVGAPVTSNFGRVQVTVQDNVTLTPVAGADVILWVATASCIGLTQAVQTTQTAGAGVAVFNAVSAGSYCATASKIIPPEKKGSTPAPFGVTAGATTATTVTIAP